MNTRSYLTLLGCVSPYQDDFGETLSTVHFVCEAKNIKATPQQNAMIVEYQVRAAGLFPLLKCSISKFQRTLFPFHIIFLKLEIKDADKSAFAYTEFNVQKNLNIQKTIVFVVSPQSQ